MTGGALTLEAAVVEFEEIVKKNLPAASEFLRKGYTDYDKSAVLEGLELHTNSLDYLKGRSPVSITFKSDATLDPLSKECNHVIVTNMGDPICHGLLHKSQQVPGEVITHDLHWTDDKEFAVLFRAHHARIDAFKVCGDFLVASSQPQTESYTIAEIALQKPLDFTPKHIYLASWPNTLGRTIRIVVYVFREYGKARADKSNLDMLGMSHGALREIADDYVDEMHSLDTESINRLASMAGPDIQVYSGTKLTRVKHMQIPRWGREKRIGGSSLVGRNLEGMLRSCSVWDISLHSPSPSPHSPPSPGTVSQLDHFRSTLTHIPISYLFASRVRGRQPYRCW
ncbi:hypothetical protein CC86DRAFT_152832 [Ophiobolus disseminans]|uniref:Uncharacterized protein n=1 Tax=Ophiobolus disseminans TaxID=1469910 RepID=A0A6A6ZF94_9PLEO|nr:hypothetical protein CC86DRAFT_152832 [Ophiobolus disseminans]